MFCSECGTKIKENAKFCFNCGKKIESLETENIDSTEEYEEQYEEEYEENKFILGEKVITLHKNAKITIYLNLAKKEGEYYAQEFLNSFDNKFNDFVGMYNYLQKDVLEKYCEIRDLLVEFCESYGYRNFKQVMDEGMKVLEFRILNEVENLEEYYDSLMEHAREEKERRAYRKQNRGRYYSIWGDASSRMNAGAKNMMTGAMYSMANGLGNASTNSEVKRKLNDIYNDTGVRNRIAGAIKEDIAGIVDFILYALNKRYNDEVLSELYSEEDKDKALNYYMLLGNLENDNEKLDCIYLILSNWGDCEMIYIDAIALFPEGIRGIRELAEFHLLNFETLIQRAAERRDEINKLNELYGEKGYYLNQRFMFNSIFKRYKFDFNKNLNEQFKKIIENENSKYIYINDKNITKDNFEKCILALENYVYLEKEIPLVLYNYESSYKNVSGILVTDERIHFVDMEGEIVATDICELNLSNINYLEDKFRIEINDKITNFSIENKEDGVKLVDQLRYQVTMINYLFSINENYKFEDELNLENRFFNNYIVVQGYEKEKKNFLEVKLNKNSLYHNVKDKFEGSLKRDLLVLWSGKDFKKIWNLNLNNDIKVKDKLSNAKRSYGNEITDEELILHDSTLLGGAKEGFIVTKNTIYMKVGMFGKPQEIKITEKSEFIIREESIIFSDGKILDLAHISNEEKIDVKRIMEVTLALMIVNNEGQNEKSVNYKQERSGKQEILNIQKNLNEDKLMIVENENIDIVEKINNVEIIKEKKKNLLTNEEIKEESIRLIESMLESETRRYIKSHKEGINNKLSKINKNLKALELEEEILFGYDTTVLGSFKNGYIFTTKYIHWKNIFGKTVSLRYEEIEEIKLEKNSFIIDDKNMEIGLIKNKNEFLEFVKALVNFINGE